MSNPVKITNLEERNDWLQHVSDIHKDAYGFRPRGYDFNSFTNEELAEFINDLFELSEENERLEEAWSKEQEIIFNENLQKVIQTGAGNKETAYRWMFDGYLGETQESKHYGVWEIESYLYSTGIMHTPTGKEVKEILNV